MDTALSVPVRPVDTKWLTDRVVTFAETVSSLVPGGYPAYARILHPAHRTLKGAQVAVSWSQVAEANARTLTPQAQWSDITGIEFLHSELFQHDVWEQEPQEGWMPNDLARNLAVLLDEHTSTSTECVFAIWEGWDQSSKLDTASSAALLLPNRTHHILVGSCHAVASFDAHLPGPNLWWPVDRAWCVATEVDDMSTFVAGDRACIDSILESAVLETIEVSASDRLHPATP